MPLDPRQADAIEITPQMIEAGAHILKEDADLPPLFSNELAKRVFLAMKKLEVIAQPN